MRTCAWGVVGGGCVVACSRARMCWSMAWLARALVRERACARAWVCVCGRARAFAGACVRMPVSVYARLCAWMQCMHACVCVHVGMCVHVYLCTCEYSVFVEENRLRVCVCACVCTHVCARAHVHAHVHRYGCGWVGVHMRVRMHWICACVCARACVRVACVCVCVSACMTRKTLSPWLPWEKSDSDLPGAHTFPSPALSRSRSPLSAV